MRRPYLCAGFLATVSILGWRVLSNTAKWMGSVKSSWSFHLVGASGLLSKCMTEISSFWLLPDKASICGLQNCDQHTPPSANVEILFGESEGTPWLQRAK